MAEEQKSQFRTIRDTQEYMNWLAEGQKPEVKKWINENLLFAIMYMLSGDYATAEVLVFGTKDFLIAKGLLKSKRNNDE